MITKIETYLFYSLFFVIPFNLGKHIIFSWNYYGGFLVDYTIPTIYLQDIIISFLLALWVYRTFRHGLTFKDLGWNSRLIFIFIFVFLLGSMTSINVYSTFYSLLRLLGYGLFAFYIAYNISGYDYSVIVRLISFSVLFISLLAVGQWFKQGSVFNNYLLFGEQPYSYSTIGIVKENLFGKTVVPSYGTFRHPNVFGGFLSVVLVWIYAFAPSGKKTSSGKLFYTVIAVGIVALFLTMSLSSYFVFFFGIFIYKALKVWRVKRSVVMLVTLVLAGFISYYLFSNPAQYEDYPSFYRRAYLNQRSLESIKNNLWFGIGYNNSFYLSGNNYDYTYGFISPQPVHNIFLVTFVEGGIFAFLTLVTLFLYVLKTTSKLLFVTFAQFTLLGFSDHYLFTIHQGILLFWLTVGFHLAYTLGNVQQD
jgi:putative inorganic carbon (hco3(-)) transporter